MRGRLAVRLALATGWLAMVLMALPPAASALTDFTWSGNVLPNTWSTPGNWMGGVAPAGPVGTLTFPAVSPSCNPGTQACAATTNDVAGITANALSIDDGYGYSFSPQAPGGAITLGAGGLTATTANSGQSTGAVQLHLPITLSASQTWSIDGGPAQPPNSPGSLAMYPEGPLTGPTSNLTIDLQRGSFLSMFGPVDHEVGAVNIVDTDKSLLGLSLNQVTLNGTDGNPVSISGGASLSMLGNDTLGPLTMSGGQVQLLGSPSPKQASLVQVNGNASLDSTSSLFNEIVGAGSSPVAGTDYSQLEATGNINLGSAQLTLSDFASPGSCSSLPVGTVYTLVSTSGGTISGTFANTPNGGVVSVSCFPGTPAAVMINYTSTAVTATVVQLTTTLSVSPSSSVTNQPVTLTAKVSTTAGAPTGIVEFQDGSDSFTPCFPAQLDSTGTATCQTSFRAATSPESLTATYLASSDLFIPVTGATSSPPVNLTVGKDTTATALATSSRSPPVGQNVTYTATVTPNHLGPIAPGAPVAFLDGGAPISSCSRRPVTEANGSSTATCTLSYAAGGSHSITASFSGGPDFLASTSAAQTVSVPSAPSVSFSSPGKNARYVRGQKVLARYTCHEGAGGPGIRSCAGTTAVGKPIDTSRPGRHAFKVTATSSDGELTTATVFYRVRLPSNRLTHVRRKAHRDGTFIVTAKVPGPGRVDSLITAWKDNLAGAARLLNPAPGRFVFARAHAQARNAGTLMIVVAPGARGRQLIAHPRYQITLRLWISYTPTHGRQRDIGYYGLHLP